MHSEIWWVFSGPTTVATDGVMFIKEKIQTEFASKVLSLNHRNDLLRGAMFLTWGAIFFNVVVSYLECKIFFKFRVLS